MKKPPISQPANPAARIGLGCVTFGREIDEAASLALLDHALERGVKMFDTAAAYGNGASESIVGRWLASRRPEGVTVATKLLPPYDRIDISGSLRRLGVDHIDLLYLHQWHESALAAGDGLNQLLGNGRVRALGASNVTHQQIISLGSLFSVVQNNQNLAVSDVSPELLSYCTAHEVSLVTYSPLGAGFLTGKHRQGAAAGSRFEIMPGHQGVYFHEAARRRLQKLKDVSRKSGHPQTRLALAWALRQPGIDCVLVGGRTPAHLDQAFEALDFSDLPLLDQLTTGEAC